MDRNKKAPPNVVGDGEREKLTSIMSLRIHSCQSSLDILLFSFQVLASVAAATGSFLIGAVIVSSETELVPEEELPPRPDPPAPLLSSSSSGKNGSFGEKDWLIRRLNDCVVDRFNGWSIDWMVYWLNIRLSKWLIDYIVNGWLVDRLI